LIEPGEYYYAYSIEEYPGIRSKTWRIFIDPCPFTYFLNDEPLIEIDKYVVSLTKISDFYGNYFDDPDLCPKTLHLSNSDGTSLSDTTYSYEDSTLTMTTPGDYTYFFSLD
jgi:hypothetical protein